MCLVTFKPTIAGFEWVKTVHALARTVTVVGTFELYIEEVRFEDSEWKRKRSRNEHLWKW
jgi:hypothetical protein